MFEIAKLAELEHAIEKLNFDTQIKEFLFNITFHKYKYGCQKDIGYVIRLIENKELDGAPSLRSNNFPNDRSFDKTRIVEINETLKNVHEMTDLDLLNNKSDTANLLTLKNEDPKLKMIMYKAHERIKIKSTVFGHKKDEDTGILNVF